MSSGSTLLKYQKDAVKAMINRTDELIGKSETPGNKRTLILKSMTGSGKTVMAANYIDELINKSEDSMRWSNGEEVGDITFLWVTIGSGSLHAQTYSSLSNKTTSCEKVVLLTQDNIKTIERLEKNNVYVLNWEKINNKKSYETGDYTNIFLRDGEDSNLRKAISKSKKQKTKIVLIIDECHTSSQTAAAKNIRDDIINPLITLEISATPSINSDNDLCESIKVPEQDVIDSGSVKKSVIINEGIGNISTLDGSDERILECAYNKLKDLQQGYLDAECDVKPLMIVQIPDVEAGEEKREMAIGFMKKEGITVENKKLSIWMSGEHLNKETSVLTPNNSSVECLIFKKAIVTGWDCPRAIILVRFRETNSFVFDLQTVGRVLRMPELRHYDNEKLNCAYIYSNVDNFQASDELYKHVDIKDLKSNFAKGNENISLKSYHIKKPPLLSLDDDFECMLFDKLNKVFIDSNPLDGQLNISNECPTDNVMRDVERSCIGISNSIGDEFIEKMSKGSGDFSRFFDNVVKSYIKGFITNDSIDIIKKTLIMWIQQNLSIDDIIHAQYVFINNEAVFRDPLNNIIDIYRKKHEQPDLIANENWKIPSSVNFNNRTHHSRASKKHILQPFYCLKEASSIETTFGEFLDGSGLVKWWWKNGDGYNVENFGIYCDGNKKIFQPDFIVMFTDERIGIFDTKAVDYNEDANKIKSNALCKYINENNGGGCNIIGGIVVQNNGGHLYVFNKPDYKKYSENPDEWKSVEKMIGTP